MNTNGYKTTELHLAVMLGYDESGRPDASRIAELIAQGADPNERNSNGDTPLHHAAGLHRHPAAIVQLAAGGADPDAANAYGDAPLHLAADHANRDCITRLVRLGADLEARDSWDRTALHRAVRSKGSTTTLDGPAEIAGHLIELGADPDARDQEGETPLHYAANLEKMILFGVIDTLIKGGADSQARNENGWTPLEVARRWHNTEVIQALEAAGNPTDSTTPSTAVPADDGRSPGM